MNKTQTEYTKKQTEYKSIYAGTGQSCQKAGSDSV